MKILILSNMYPSSKSPGYGTFVKKFETSMIANGVICARVVIDNQPIGVIKKLKAYLSYILRAWYHLFFDNYDVIYVHFAAHSLLPVTFCRFFLKKPLVINVHGSDILPENIIKKTLLKFNLRTINKASLIVVPSEYYRNLASTLAPKCDVVVSPSSGVDLKKFFPDPTLKNINEFRIGFVSRLIAGKGWNTLLLALSLCKNRAFFKSIKVDLVGGGADFQECADMVKRLGLNEIVTLHNSVAHEKLPSFFASFDVFIFPTEAESLGLVGLEAMACGCPVIGSDIPGISTYLNNNVNGFTFAVSNPEALAKAIEDYYVLSSREREFLSKNAIMTAKKFETGLVGRHLYLDLMKHVGNKNEL